MANGVQASSSAPPKLPLSEIDQKTIFREDFELHEKLGSGSYGQVFRTRFKHNDEIYALKQLDKEFIIKVSSSNSNYQGRNNICKCLTDNESKK